MKLAYAHNYRQNAVQTASSSQLILMLFDGAMRFMSQAVQGFEEAELNTRQEIVHINLVKTQAILHELRASLNLEVGGEFARTMANLYEFMRVQLREANLHKVVAPVHVVMELLGEIRAAWSAMMAQTANQAPVAWVATAA